MAFLLSAAEALASRRGRVLFALTAALLLLALLWYVEFPQRPLVTASPSGVSVAGGAEYELETALNYTIVCVLLLAPSLSVVPLWRSVDWRFRLVLGSLFLAFVLPAVSVVAPRSQYRWFMMLLTLVTPYTVAGLSRLSRKVLGFAALGLVVLGSAYPFTEYGYTHFAVWPKAIAYARGYPWKLAPAIANATDVKNAAEAIESFGGVTLVNLGFYPQLHLYIRNPANVVIVERTALPWAVSYAVARNLSRVLVATPANLTAQLEKFRANPSLYNATMSALLGEGRYVSVDEVECRALYSGSTLSVYVVEVSGRSKE